MKVNFFYNLKKIFNKLEVFKLRRHAIDSNLFLLNKKCNQVKSILLYFPDYEMMHFGDHLFFEPLARHLRSNGYKLIISPINAMEFYFQDLGYRIGSDSSLENIDLIITKVEFIGALKKIESQILFIDTASSKIKLPLCNDMIEKVSEFLGVQYVDYNPVPSYSYVVNEGNLSFLGENNNYIIFNNYIDSGSIRSGSTHQNSIIDFVKNLKDRTGFKVVHTGSNNDKNCDSRVYDFVDIDIRGKTSIKDLFTLCSLNNVIYNVSFDGFQMHLFFIQNKKSFVLFRGRLIKKNEEYIKKYVNPPFLHDNPRSLIEYIE